MSMIKADAGRYTVVSTDKTIQVIDATPSDVDALYKKLVGSPKTSIYISYGRVDPKDYGKLPVTTTPSTFI